MQIPPEVSLQEGNEYCTQCFKTPLTMTEGSEGKRYACSACGTISNRRISIAGSLRWWLDSERTLWHESAGIFVFNREGRILFFELTKFPFGLTIPAGHRHVGEEGMDTAKRELLEETGLQAKTFQPLGIEDIANDSCGRGADSHRWHLYTCIPDSFDMRIDSAEGKDPTWLSIEEALLKKLTAPVAHCIGIYKDVLKDTSVEAQNMR